MKLKFKAKPGSQISNNNANTYGLRLFELMKELGKDSITAREVVNDATNTTAPYHDYFEWNNRKAGEQHRLEQARHILHSIIKIVIINNQQKVVKVFHNVIIEDVREYAPENIVFNSAELSVQIIKMALIEAKNWHERYKTYQELSSINNAIEITLKKHGKKK